VSARPCDNFLYGFKGAPAARQRRAKTRREGSGREVIEQECVTVTGTARTKAGERWAHCPTWGAAAVSQLHNSGLAGSVV
jgi:hypothetical protein